MARKEYTRRRFIRDTAIGLGSIGLAATGLRVAIDTYNKPNIETEKRANALKVQTLSELLIGTEFEDILQEPDTLTLLHILVDRVVVTRDEIGRPLILFKNNYTGDEIGSLDPLFFKTDKIVGKTEYTPFELVVGTTFQDIQQTPIDFPWDWTQESKPIIDKIKELHLDQLNAPYITDILTTHYASILEKYTTNSIYPAHLENFMLFASYMYFYSPDGIKTSHRKLATVTLEQEEEYFNQYIDVFLTKLHELDVNKTGAQADYALISTEEFVQLIQASRLELLEQDALTASTGNFHDSPKHYADIQTIQLWFLSNNRTKSNVGYNFYRSNITSDPQVFAILNKNEKYWKIFSAIEKSLEVSRYNTNVDTITRDFRHLYDWLLLNESDLSLGEKFVFEWSRVGRQFWQYETEITKGYFATENPSAHEIIKNLDRQSPPFPQGQTDLGYLAEWLRVTNN